MGYYTVEQVQTTIDLLEGEHSVSLSELMESYPLQIHPEEGGEIRFFRNYDEMFTTLVKDLDVKDKKQSLTNRLYRMLDDVAYPKMDVFASLDYTYNLLGRTVDGEDKFIISASNIKDIYITSKECIKDKKFVWLLFIDTSTPKLAVLHKQ